MVCETKREASRVAYFGAIKMDEQSYQYKEFWPFALEGGQLRKGGYIVRRGLTAYEVNDTDTVPTRTLTCTCPFFKDNAAHGVCKHTTRIEWILKEQEATARRDAEEDAMADEATARMEAMEGLEGDRLTRAYGRA